MSESTEGSESDSGDSGFEPITSQEDFEKRIGSRLARESKKYADYAELKAKASKLDELEAASAEANKSWEQKYRDLESKLADKELAILKVEVAAAKGVPPNRLNGSTREELEADAEELAALIAKESKPKLPPTGLKSGASGSDSRMDPKERAAAALRAYRNN